MSEREQHDRWYQERAQAGWWLSKEQIEAARAGLTREQAEHARLQARRASAVRAVFFLAVALVLLTAVLGGLLWLVSS